MPGRRHASRGRRAARRHSTRSAAPTQAEITVYGLLAAGIAAGLLIVAGQPWWMAVAVVAGTLAMLGLLAIVNARSEPSPRPDPSAHSEPSTPPDANTSSEPERPPGPRRRRHKK